MKKETKLERSIRKKEQTKINTLKKLSIKREKKKVKLAKELLIKEKRDKEIEEMKKLCPSGMALANFPRF